MVIGLSFLMVVKTLAKPLAKAVIEGIVGAGGGKKRKRKKEGNGKEEDIAGTYVGCVCVYIHLSIHLLP